MTEPNPCQHCREKPTGGFYPGDYAIECANCLVFISEHMIDFSGTFEVRAARAKRAAIISWNLENPKGE